MSARLVQTTPLLPADFNERLAQAFSDLNSPLCDLRNMASIAANLTCEADGADNVKNLANFAVYQTEKMAEELVAEYSRLLQAARKT